MNDPTLGQTLQGKRVFVTGGSGGIGAAIISRFCAAGAQVVATHRRSPAPEEFIKMGCQFIHLDVRDSEAVTDVINKAAVGMGGLDVLVNCAGLTRDSPLFAMSDEDFDIVLRTNLYSCFYTSRAVLPWMVKQKKGSIVNVSSVAGFRGVSGQSNYCASKAGVIALTSALSEEMGRKGIRVNAVAPGYIDTAMLTASHIDESTVKSSTALRRIGTPADVASVVAFLASDESAYITGEVIRVDGGIP